MQCKATSRLSFTGVKSQWHSAAARVPFDWPTEVKCVYSYACVRTVQMETDREGKQEREKTEKAHRYRKEKDDVMERRRIAIRIEERWREAG